MCSNSSSSSGPFRHAVKIVALCSLLMGIGICGLSSWILHKSLQMKKNHEINGKEFLTQVSQFFGGVSGTNGPGLYDYDVVFRILITNSATALSGGVLQLLFSLALFLATIQGGSLSRFIGKVWVYSHVIIMLIIGSATLCILTNELQINPSITVFLISTGTDALLLILFMWIVFTWAFSDDEGSSDDDEVKSRRVSHPYHSPPGYLTTVSAPPPVNNNGNGVENFRDVKLRPVSVV